MNIPELLRELELNQHKGEYRITCERLSHWTGISSYRMSGIISGRLMPTEGEWQKIANFIGGKFRLIPYSRIEESFNLGARESRQDQNSTVALGKWKHGNKGN